MTIFLLIRHGQNDLLGDSLAGRLPNVHLNEVGQEEAQRLGELLSKVPIKAVYASPMERAQETAAPIAARQGLKIETLPELIEIDFGDWQGKKFKELKQQALWDQIHEQPSAIQFPNGEGFAAARDRVVGGLLKLSGQYDKKDILVCVAHGDVIRLAVAHFMGLPLDNFHRIHISPASISVLHLNERQAFFGPINFTDRFPKFSN
jgi:probable phosphoglycerate mutase